MFEIHCMDYTAKLLTWMGTSLVNQTTPSVLYCYEYLEQVHSPFRCWKKASSCDKQGDNNTLPLLGGVVGGSSTHLTKMSYIHQLTLLYFSGDSTDDPLSWRV